MRSRRLSQTKGFCCWDPHRFWELRSPSGMWIPAASGEKKYEHLILMRLGFELGRHKAPTPHPTAPDPYGWVPLCLTIKGALIVFWSGCHWSLWYHT